MQFLRLLDRALLSTKIIQWCLLFNVVAHTWLDCAFAQSTPSYGPWTSWSQCSVSCADGVRFRYRQCPHVKSDPAYRHCPGEPIMFQDCQNPPCSATLQPAQPTGAPADASGGILEVDLDCDFECAPDTPDCSQLEAACRSSIHDPSANSHGNFFGGGAGRRRRRRSIGRRSLVHGGNIGHTYVAVNTVLLSVVALSVISVLYSFYACRKTRPTSLVDVVHCDAA